jgi:hypothetical protein
MVLNLFLLVRVTDSSLVASRKRSALYLVAVRCLVGMGFARRGIGFRDTLGDVAGGVLGGDMTPKGAGLARAVGDGPRAFRPGIHD